MQNDLARRKEEQKSDNSPQIMEIQADQRVEFIERLAAEREERNFLKSQTILVIALQAHVRGMLQRRRFNESVRKLFDGLFAEFTDLDKDKQLVDCKKVLHCGHLFVLTMKSPYDVERLCQFCRCLIMSMSSTNVRHSYAALLLSKNFIQSANRLIISLYLTISKVFDELQVEKVSHGKSVTLLIHFLVTFSSSNTWAMVRDNASICDVLNQMCNKMFSGSLADSVCFQSFSQVLNRMIVNGRLSLGSSAFNGLFSILFRILKNTNFDFAQENLFVKHCITCPALLIFLSPANIDCLVKNRLFEKALNVLAVNPDLLYDLSGNQCLFLLANLVHLSFLDQNGLVEYLIDWTNVMNSVLIRCNEFVVKKKGTRSHWHPIFGWYVESINHSNEGCIPLAARQLQYLWSKPIVTCLFDKILNCKLEKHPAEQSSFLYPSSDLGTSIQRLWKKLNSIRVDGQGMETTNSLPTVSMTAIVCQLYQNALSTLYTLHTNIISELCREDFLLPQLWEHIVSLSPSDCGLSYVLNLMSLYSIKETPHFAPFSLFANCATSVISILDEKEMYESAKPFSQVQLCTIAKFCNLFCFRVIWNAYLDVSQISQCSLYKSVYQLCMLLYSRDCRRSFTKHDKFWIAPDVKSTVIMNEFEKKTERALFLMSRMSHLVALSERIVLFKKYISAEKESSSSTPSTLITVGRARLLDDGFRQLSLLSPSALKSTIRVKFINQQGLDEAGIDQDGVFKEFLELTLKQVFHPDLNLFKCSESRQLFPSPTSGLHNNHLTLFQFVGRMLAKAIYEGIVVEVNLAPVLLASVLDRTLCAFDELSQLDPDLYRSLTYIKHYSDSDDVADLSLTFSVDEDVLGHVQTVELVPGGRAIQVTNENKIAYVHKMARYRVFDQTKEQCRAFVSGFLSVLSGNWLSLFSPHELQFLISGDSSDVDLRDLRKHVQYYGGFHSNHRVIKWLWQIFESDFSSKERRLFLKFVTSCSRAPILGFAYLEPPFSIRCVEVSDDQDQGDTLASVVRGFLAIKRRQSPTRLPTASTCFNLLKLPNYSRKSILLQKLRYAIHSETGFELS